MKRINLFLATMLFALTGVASNISDDVQIKYNADGSVSITPTVVEGVEFKTDGGHVKAIVKDSLLPDNHSAFRFVLSGESMDGSFTLKSQDGAVVVLDGLNLISRQGAPLWLRTKSGSSVSVAEGKENILTLVAVKDTAKQKSAVLFANSDLNISGKGRLVLTSYANGCKGLNVKNNLTIADLKLDIVTTGDNLGPDTTRRMGPPPGFDGHMPEFDMDKMPEEVKAFFEQMKKQAQNGNGGPQGFPFGGMPQGMPQGGFGGFPGGGFPGGFPEGGFPDGGFGGKQKYMGTCKGIKVGGQLTIESGNITVSTKSRGAEGIEGKNGVTINGGVVDIKSMDDAISSNGRIIFNGGKTTAWSIGNDAIDTNSNAEGAITIAGGTVYGFCQCGSPEEGFDSDFSPVVITGGTAFGIGGSLGGMTTKPSLESSKQPSVVINNLNVKEGDKVELYHSSNKKVPVAVIAESLPFTFDGSHTLLTSPELKVGEKYILKVGKTEKKFKMDKNFITIGEESMGGFGGFPMGGFPGGGFPGGGFPGGGMGGGFPGGGMPF